MRSARRGCRCTSPCTATRKRCTSRAITWSPASRSLLAAWSSASSSRRPAAYALAHFRIRRAGVVLLAILVSQMVPGIVLANALYTAYNDVGLLNSIWGLILADSTAGVPFAMLILRAFMQSIPTEVIEAAYVDGAGPVRTFFAIVLPLSRNALVSAGLFTFLFAWGDFLFALTLTTSDHVRPVTLGIYTYIGAYVHDWSSVMATAVLASLPALRLADLGAAVHHRRHDRRSAEVRPAATSSRNRSETHRTHRRNAPAIRTPFDEENNDDVQS